MSASAIQIVSITLGTAWPVFGSRCWNRYQLRSAPISKDDLQLLPLKPPLLRAFHLFPKIASDVISARIPTANGCFNQRTIGGIYNSASFTDLSRGPCQASADAVADGRAIDPAIGSEAHGRQLDAGLSDFYVLELAKTPVTIGNRILCRRMCGAAAGQAHRNQESWATPRHQATLPHLFRNRRCNMNETKYKLSLCTTTIVNFSIGNL